MVEWTGMVEWISEMGKFHHYLELNNSRMAQTTQWLQAIQNCMKKVKLIISTVCMASFPARTAMFTANYLTTPLGVAKLTIRTHCAGASLAF